MVAASAALSGGTIKRVGPTLMSETVALLMAPEQFRPFVPAVQRLTRAMAQHSTGPNGVDTRLLRLLRQMAEKLREAAKLDPLGYDLSRAALREAAAAGMEDWSTDPRGLDFDICGRIDVECHLLEQLGIEPLECFQQ